jgi:hypothetical protein
MKTSTFNPHQTWPKTQWRARWRMEETHESYVDTYKNKEMDMDKVGQTPAR